MTTTRKTDSAAADRPATPSAPLLAERARPTGAAWDPLRAWQLHGLYAPLATAVVALLAARRRTAPARVLLVGGSRSAFEAFLEAERARTGAKVEWQIAHIAAAESALVELDGSSYDCVAAVDWLPLVAPSSRRGELERLCRTASAGVVLVNAFDSPATRAAERAVNALFRAVHGVDHPALGRHLELGLPDAETAASWLEPLLPYVAAWPVESVALWRAVESLVAGGPEPLDEPTDADVAAAAVYPDASGVDTDEPAHRTLVVAAAEPVPPAARVPVAAAGSHAGLVAFAMHATLEAAGQRRSLDRVLETITAERERERAEFRTTIASLAAEVRDLEAQAETLDAEVRERGRVLSNQNATMLDTERHVENLELVVEQAAEREEKTAVHVRNVEALRVLTEQRADAAEARLAETEARLAAAEAERAELEARLDVAEARLAESEAGARDVERRRSEAEAAASLATEHAKFMERTHEGVMSSPAGRVLKSYVRAKRAILGRK